MTDKNIVLITGANTGLGLATVKSMYESSTSFHILAAGRTIEKVANAIASFASEPSPGNSTIEPIVVDITDDASIAAAAQLVESKYGRLDTLINNAGAAYDVEFQGGRMSEREAWNKTLEINVSSVQVTIATFAPLLLKAANGARLLVMTSGLASMQEEHTHTSNAENWLPEPAPGWPKKPALRNQQWAYRTSKVALNMLFLQWARIFEADPVKMFCIAPGFLATGFGGVSRESQIENGAVDPSVGANFVRDVVEGKRDDEAGKAIRRTMTLPW